MYDDQRPDPDALLKQIQQQEARSNRGRLKIFFGMAAGVGKTYAMLQAAHERKAEGVDVVVGIVETHGRAETHELLEGLEVIPRQKLEHRGALLEEMDTDAILQRAPQLVLVDELAHTNVPGSRHIKRYLDVIDLLEAGLNVYTTVNVQHFESRADAVRQITGITVHETLPDTLMELADEIELIDVSPEELRKRLAEGKVYTAERADMAAQNFFRVGNLTALREMALRFTAERVDHQLQNYMQVKRIAGPWKSGERLMVAVGPSPFSERLIRWTRRMAYNLEAPWLAVYVETPNPLTEKDKERLAQNLSLARRLGAEVVITAGARIADTLVNLARQRNVSQIVAGKPQHTFWQNLFRGGSLVDSLVRNSGDIDVYVVTGDHPEDHQDAAPVTDFDVSSSKNLRPYLLASLVIAGMTLLSFIIQPFAGYLSVGLIELLAVLLVAIYLGRGPALLAAALSAISWNFLFIDPRYTFVINEPQDVILFILYFAIAIIAGNLTARLRLQERQAQFNADRAMALFQLAHATASAIDMDDVLRTASEQIRQSFDAEVVILISRNGKLERAPHVASNLQIDEKEYSVAAWVFENGKPAGRFTNTLPLAHAYYLPLLTSERSLGVLGIAMRQPASLSADQEILLETFANQIALVIEREYLDEAAEQSAMLQESERLYTTLLNSISHELRTPIATITGAASSLADQQTGANESARKELITGIQVSAERLNRLVANLLDMSRLESGRLKLKLEWCEIGDVVAVALKRLENRLENRPVSINLPAGLPLVEIDFVFMEQVLVNLLDNVCTYTPAATPIDLSASINQAQMKIAITDYGPGIPEDDLERIFEKFYRLPGAISGGTGLGLSVCRGLVAAHGGTLTAENVAGAGARFTITLPLGVPPSVKEAEL